jgi:hypothetical protein
MNQFTITISSPMLPILVHRGDIAGATASLLRIHTGERREGVIDLAIALGLVVTERQADDDHIDSGLQQ